MLYRRVIKSFRTLLIFAALCTAVLFVILPAPVAGEQGSRFFHPLKTKLARDGFDKKALDVLYGQKGVFFNLNTVSAFFVYREARLNYDQFSKPRYIKQAGAYMQQHAQSLAAAENDFGVDKEVITAIILVETKLGQYTGRTSILSILSTMAVLSDTDPKNVLWAHIVQTQKISRKHFEQKAQRKSVWAYNELKAFLTYCRNQDLNPTELKGSFAGAIGIAQFLPSNILAYGKDGNHDNRIDLFDHADAIISIANYLKHYGWQPGIDQKKAYKVVWKYNHSKYYVNAVLKVAKLLKGQT